jgi:hypothetical protein
MMPTVHLDTDLGGDIDDLCALAMLLRWEDLDFTGITTVAEAGGKRAGYARYVLEMENRGDIPVASGAEVSGGFYRYSELGYPDEERYWPEPVDPLPNPTDDALQLLKQSIFARPEVPGHSHAGESVPNGRLYLPYSIRISCLG